MRDATIDMRPAFDRQEDGSDAALLLFTADDFARVREMIYRIAGISLSPAKKELVYSRLARRLRARRLSSFAEYLRLLESGDATEREEFINALTTNMTSFFREPHHFQILAQHLGSLPRNRSIPIWTCASSSGEEPYSIAMTAVEHFGSFDTPVKILATDIDTSVLERARRGVYPLNQLQKLSSARLKRFFLKGEGKNEGFVRVRPELQRMVTFGSLNLREEQWALGEKFAAIFCRNVMIYFDRETQYDILKRLARYLQPDGLFFAGHSESFHHAADLFRSCGRTVYSLNNCPALPEEPAGTKEAHHHAHQSTHHR